MVSEKYVQRGRRLLNQAHQRFEFFDHLFTSRQWNMAIREAHDALEQAVKAAILLTGNESVRGHKAQAVEQLKELLEYQIQLSSSGRPEIASRVQDIYNYYALRHTGSNLMVMKKVGAVYTHLGTCSLPGPNMIIDLEVDGSTLTAKADERVLSQMTDTSLTFGFLDRWYFPVKVTVPYWDQLFSAARTLGKLREPSFYEETQYSRDDAVEAGQHMQSAVDLLRAAFGVLS